MRVKGSNHCGRLQPLCLPRPQVHISSSHPAQSANHCTGKQLNANAKPFQPSAAGTSAASTPAGAAASVSGGVRGACICLPCLPEGHHSFWLCLTYCSHGTPWRPLQQPEHGDTCCCCLSAGLRWKGAQGWTSIQCCSPSVRPKGSLSCARQQHASRGNFIAPPRPLAVLSGSTP